MLLQVYSDLGKSQVVHTSWAMLALIAAGWHRRDAKPLAKAASYLLAAQQASGDWPQQHITGVFNRNCMISYSNYRCRPTDTDSTVPLADRRYQHL